MFAVEAKDGGESLNDPFARRPSAHPLRVADPRASRFQTAVCGPGSIAARRSVLSGGPAVAGCAINWIGSGAGHDHDGGDNSANGFSFSWWRGQRLVVAAQTNGRLERFAQR